MQRINVQYFYRLATALRPLANLETGPLIKVFGPLYTAEQELEVFLWNTLIRPVTCFQSGYNLYQMIGELTNQIGDSTKELTAADVSGIATSLNQFEIVFAAEFARKDTFMVPKKGIYSTTDLVEGQAEQMFPEKVRNRIPLAMPDINEAGKCLALELPTAAAFHIFRAVESVSKQYVTIFRGTPPGDKERGLGKHVSILRGTDADDRVVKALDQMRGLHRNPVMHPEKSLSEDEVQTALGIAQSLITAMVANMEAKSPVPDPVLTELLPDPEFDKLDLADFLDESVASGGEDEDTEVSTKAASIPPPVRRGVRTAVATTAEGGVTSQEATNEKENTKD